MVSVQTVNAKCRLDGFALSDCSAEEWDSEVVLVYSDGSKILNNTISGSSSHGISVLNSEDHLISGNHIHGNFKAEIHLAGANYCQIAADDINQNAYGIFIETSYQNWISDCGVWGNGADGIVIESSMGNELAGNAVHNNSENGLLITESSNNIIIAN